MPNTFISLEVPKGDGVGAAVDTAGTGHPKTFVLAGPVRAGARYVVEGSNDGGVTWDILVDDDDGTQVLFTSRSSGAKSADCIVGKVRVRAIAGPLDADPPSMTMGAPPAGGPGIFGKLDVPTTSGMGAPLDLGLSAGPLKTFVLRGPIPPGSRYTILASMDGAQFDEVMLFTADQQGARSRKVMCRFVRVARLAPGAAPVVAVGAEGLPSGDGGGGGGGGSTDVSVAGERTVATTRNSGEELLAEYLVPIGELPGDRLNLTFSAIARRERAPGSEEPADGSLKIRLGGTAGQSDGELVATVGSLPEAEGASTVVNVLGIPRPTVPGTLVKLLGEATRGRVTARGYVFWFAGR